MINDSNPYPQFDEQPQQIQEPPTSQTIPVIPLDAVDMSRPIGQGSGEERKQFLLESLRALAVQQVVNFLLAFGFSYQENWGFCSNFFLFLFFEISLHIAVSTFKSRNYLKQNQLMHINWLLWVVSFPFAITLFSTLLKVEYFGWFYYLPFLTATFFLPIITIGMIINLKTRNENISSKKYNILFFVSVLFIDLTIAMFDDGFIHFGYLIGEFISYLYGLYLLHINVQIQFPVNDLSLNLEPEETKFDQMFNQINKGTELLGVGQFPQETQEITVEQVKNQFNPKVLIKYLIFLAFSFVFSLIPWLYVILFVWILIAAHKCDSKFIQIGKKQEIKLNEQFTSPILIYIDIFGGLKYAIE